ncbi:MAG: polymerase, sigma-24 subunit, subfamily [Actinomycetia bacterium]|nr:polymerase, sigma-24 subunit, subfamily [Actinomycetes bacterium]
MGELDPERRFEEIYMTQYPAVLSYVRRRTRSPDDAADAIAETFTTAWRRLAHVPAGEETRLWLYGVARRVLANQHRGEARRTALAERLRSEMATWTDPVEDRDNDAVRTAFQRLSSDDRELLALSGWEGLRPSEIATVLGCSGGALRIRLHRARKRLAKELDAVGLDLARYGSRATALSEVKS